MAVVVHQCFCNSFYDKFMRKRDGKEDCLAVISVA